MFEITDLLLLTIFAFIVYAFVLAMRTKEIANKAAEQYCKQMEVQFLDQTVFLKKINLKRNDHSQLRFIREYYFEFTVTGEDRYFGRVFMIGNRVESINLDPHKMH